MMPRGDAGTAWKWAGVTGPFKIGLGAERAGLHTRCNESPAIMHAKIAAGKRLSDQVRELRWRPGVPLYRMSWKGASRWLFRALPRRRIPGRPRTPQAGAPFGSRIR